MHAVYFPNQCASMTGQHPQYAGGLATQVEWPCHPRTSQRCLVLLKGPDCGANIYAAVVPQCASSLTLHSCAASAGAQRRSTAEPVLKFVYPGLSELHCRRCWLSSVVLCRGVQIHPGRLLSARPPWSTPRRPRRCGPPPAALRPCRTTWRTAVCACTPAARGGAGH